VALLAQMPVKAVADQVGEHDTRLWRLLHHHVEAARAALDLAEVTRDGVDETSAKRGQDYVSLFVDLDASKARVIFATQGRDHPPSRGSPPIWPPTAATRPRSGTCRPI
jgi:transposase